MGGIHHQNWVVYGIAIPTLPPMHWWIMVYNGIWFQVIRETGHHMACRKPRKPLRSRGWATKNSRRSFFWNVVCENVENGDVLHDFPMKMWIDVDWMELSWLQWGFHGRLLGMYYRVHYSYNQRVQVMAWCLSVPDEKLWILQFWQQNMPVFCWNVAQESTPSVYPVKSRWSNWEFP